MLRHSKSYVTPMEPMLWNHWLSKAVWFRSTSLCDLGIKREKYLSKCVRLNQEDTSPVLWCKNEGFSFVRIQYLSLVYAMNVKMQAQFGIPCNHTSTVPEVLNSWASTLMITCMFTYTACLLWMSWEHKFTVILSITNDSLTVTVTINHSFIHSLWSLTSWVWKTS